MQLMPHQEKAIKQLGNGKILYGGVGSGKSLTIIAYYLQNEAPKDIYVITTARKRDLLEWEREAVKFGIGTDRMATTAGKLTIDSWNNIGRYTEIEDAFFIFDEQRLVGSGAWVKSFLKIAKNNHWVMLTATPGDTWLDYAPVFIANNLYRNITEFKREHVIYAPFSKYPKILRYVGVSTLERYRNMILVEMPYIKHTTRILQNIICGYDVQMFRKAYVERWHVFENRPIIDVSELFRVMRKIVGTDPSRLDNIRLLLEKHPKMIIFYNFDYELEILRRLSDCVTVAEWNGHKKHSIPKTDSWVYLVQYISGAEGWNCTDTDAMAFYSLTYSYKNFEQAQGRIDRLDTPFSDLHYYILVSDSMIDRAVQKSLANKEMFNERAFAQKMGI